MKKITCDLCGYDIGCGQFKKHREYCNGLGPRRMRPTKGHHAWNKGLTTPDSVKEKISLALIGKLIGRAKTPEAEEARKKKISETMKRKKLGGYRKGSGRGRQGRYKGIWCDSSWELAWVIYQLDHGVEFERNWEKFDYVFEGKNRKYSPDFKIGDTFIEIKGYMTDQAKTKIDQFPETIVMVGENEMMPIIEFVKLKYGDNFVSLYEK
jgi:hypothetical protein